MRGSPLERRNVCLTYCHSLLCANILEQLAASAAQSPRVPRAAARDDAVAAMATRGQRPVPGKDFKVDPLFTGAVLLEVDALLDEGHRSAKLWCRRASCLQDSGSCSLWLKL